MQLQIEDARCREAVERISSQVAARGGRALLVGGCVRDAALGRAIRDVDLEVFGVDLDALEALIGQHFSCRRVGTDFPVLKLGGLSIDVSVPRSPELSFGEAARRRDFTINALGWDPLAGTGDLLDPLGGRLDLERRILRRCSDHFSEDPLRVLRGMQLVARFDLEVAPETLAFCRSLAPAGVAPERLFEEWRKLLLRGEQIGRGLGFLQASGWLEHFPELAALPGCPQDPEWHPEGDVWVHTGHCLDAFARARTGDDREDLIVGLAVLCHDLGKPATTRVEENGRITSKRHEVVGSGLALAFLTRLTAQGELLEQVPRLVASHLAPSMCYRDRAGDAAIRRLACRVGDIERLIRVAAADYAGRPPLPARPFEAGEWLRERARALAVHRSAPAPLLKGRHLIDLGLEPGPGFQPLLDACYEAQLEGDVTTLDEALAFTRSRLGG